MLWSAALNRDFTLVDDSLHQCQEKGLCGTLDWIKFEGGVRFHLASFPSACVLHSGASVPSEPSLWFTVLHQSLAGVIAAARGGIKNSLQPINRGSLTGRLG